MPNPTVIDHAITIGIGTTSIIGHSVPSLPNDLVYVTVFCPSTGAQVTGVTGAGVTTWRQRLTQTNGLEIFWGIVTTGQVSTNVTVAMSSGASTQPGFLLIRGANSVAPFDSLGTPATPTGNTATFTTVNPPDLLIWGGFNTSSGAASGPAGWTLIEQNNWFNLASTTYSVLLELTTVTGLTATGSGAAFVLSDAITGGPSVVTSTGTATAVAAVSGAGQAVVPTTGAASGIAAIFGASRGLAAATWDTNGIAAVSGACLALASATGAALGTADVSGVGTQILSTHEPAPSTRETLMTCTFTPTDIANIWVPDWTGADFMLDMEHDQFVSNRDLVTAITNSLFSNRLALPADPLPNLDHDRMGWWADPYLIADPTVNQRLGSRVWLLMRSKSSNALLPIARGYVEESLVWLTAKGIASSVVVETSFVFNDPSKLQITITVTRHGKDTLNLSYKWAWDQLSAEPCIIPIPPAPTFTVNAAGLGLPPGNTPFSRWIGGSYKYSDLLHADYFTEPTLDQTIWWPWICGATFTNPQGSRTISVIPNSLQPDNPDSSSGGDWIGQTTDNPGNGLSTWMTNQFLENFNTEIYSAFPSGGSFDTGTGDHLVTGPGVAYPGGGLALTAVASSYPVDEFGVGTIFGHPAEINNGSSILRMRPTFLVTAVTSAATAPGTAALHFSPLPPGITRGMEINDLTHPDRTYINYQGIKPYGEPCCVRAVIGNTVILSRATGVNGVPLGDTIEFKTGIQSKLETTAVGLEPRLWVTGPGIPEHTTTKWTNTRDLDWTAISAVGAQNWSDAKMSRDGTVLIACANPGLIYTSTDSGATWTATAAASSPWDAVAQSEDGAILYGVDGNLWQSLDSGATWTDIFNIGVVNNVCCSNDGSIVYITIAGGGTTDTRKSDDTGATFNVIEDTSFDPSSIACSADGSVVLMASQFTNLYRSMNGGSTWLSDPVRNYPVPWANVYVSPDGGNMVAVENGGIIYTSQDSGATWLWQIYTGQNPELGNLHRAACQAADGSKLIQGFFAEGSLLYYCDDPTNQDGDFGIGLWLGPSATNNPPSGKWAAILCNDDFDQFVVFAEGGFIYTATGLPDQRLDLSNAATATNADARINFSQWGFVSAYLTGNEFVLPAEGGYWQFRMKYPHDAGNHGMDAGINIYTQTGSTGLMNFSFESGYISYDETAPPQRQFLLGLADGASAGLVPETDPADDFHTYAFEYWPDLAFSAFYDNELFWSTASCVFVGALSGSTLTVADLMPIVPTTDVGRNYPSNVDTSFIPTFNQGELARNQWLRWPGLEARNVFLHAGAGLTWEVYIAHPIASITWETTAGGQLFVTMAEDLPVTPLVGDMLSVTGVRNYGTASVDGANIDYEVFSVADASHFVLSAPDDTNAMYSTMFGGYIGLPADLNVTSIMAGSAQNTVIAHWNANGGPHVPGIDVMMLSNCAQFHTIADFVEHPGPYTVLITGTDIYKLPGA